MSTDLRRLCGIGVVCLALLGSSVWAEETQDSPLYGHTLKAALGRGASQSGVAPSASTQPASTGSDDGVIILAQASATTGPTAPTVCPVRDTMCPPSAATVCPPQRTACPVRTTACPGQVATTCPQVSTQCPTYATMCPGGPTACPPASTRCPAQATACPVQRTVCPQVVNGACPPGAATTGPVQRTTCPERTTVCPPQVATTCPQVSTQCPTYVTMCPPTATNCPLASTRCPGQATQCPVQRTSCPTLGTACPPDVATTCPIVATQCPVKPTGCPGGKTNCPVKVTNCPVVTTTCPNGPTWCPAQTTVCPAGATFCPAAATACPTQVTVCPQSVTMCPAGCGGSTGPCQFVSPKGNPTIDATAEFSYDDQFPGVCRIPIRVKIDSTNLGGDLTNRVRASISQVQGTTLTWEDTTGHASNWTGLPPAPAGCMPNMGLLKVDITGDWVVTAVLTDLPAANAEFGPKRIYVQVISASGIAVEAIQNIEIFYDHSSWNHPPVGSVDSNWFYYWKQGGVVTSSKVDWLWADDPTSYGFYYPGDPNVFITDLASDVKQNLTFTKDDLVTSLNVGGEGHGPYAAAETIAHEGYHMFVNDVLVPQIAIAELDGENDGDDWDDPDDDLIPNWMEPVSNVPTILPTLNTDPNDPDTYNLDAVFGPGVYDTYGDQEIRCRALSMDFRVDPVSVGTIAVNRLIDWSYHGRNSVPVYPDPFDPTTEVPPRPALWWTPWP